MLSARLLRSVESNVHVRHAPAKSYFSTTFSFRQDDHGTSSSHRDPLSQAVKSGTTTHSDKPDLDAASRDSGGKQATRDDSKGNPEGVGFAEQVGGASAANKSSAWEGKGPSEEATPPSILDSLKNLFGFKKIGKRPPKPGTQGLHSSVLRMDSGAERDLDVQGRASGSSRQPKDSSVHLEQDPRLDSGNGDTVDHSDLPSHQQSSQSASTYQRRNLFSSSRPTEESSADRVHNREAERAEKAAQASYQTVPEDQPYGDQEKLRYGGKQNWSKEEDKGTDHPGSGPEGESAWGRKPEEEGS